MLAFDICIVLKHRITLNPASDPVNTLNNNRHQCLLETLTLGWLVDIINNNLIGLVWNRSVSDKSTRRGVEQGGGAQQGVVISRSILVANPLTLIERQQAVETRDMRRVGGGLIWGLTFWVGRGGDQDLGAARDSEFRGWWFWGHQFWDSAVLSSGSLQFVLWALFYDQCSEVQVYNGRWELATVCFRNIFVKYGPPLQLKYVQNSPNIWCHNLDTIRCHIQQSIKFDSYPGRAGGAPQREARTKPCPSPPPASFLHPPNIFHTSDARSSVPHI